MKKFIVIAFMALAVTMIATVPAKASDVTPTEVPSPTPTPEVNDYYKLPLVRGDSFNINNMMRYYHEVLTEDQQKITRFLIGTYNYMYLTARGFTYENVQDLDDYIQKFDELASFVVGIDSNYVETNSSRWSTNFQIYIASIITYAGSINKSFNAWLQSDAAHVLIPYTSEGLDAWTTYYNDPSNEGVADFGSETREWTLGNVYPFLMGDYTMGGSAQEHYNDFVLNKSPFMWTDYQSDFNVQIAISFKDKRLVDTIYVLRSQQGQGLSQYRFGFYDGTFTNYDFDQLYLYQSNGIVSYSTGYAWIRYNFDVMYTSSPTTIQDLINQAMYATPFKFYQNGQQYFHNWYYGITHIVLVDNLQTLANRQDVLNDYSLGLITDYDWINKPVDNGLPYWWKPIDFEIEIEKPNGDLDPPEQDQLQPSIINNTVINNYEILAPGSIINVPVDWLQSDGNYLDYTNTTALPFFVMVGDIFNALGELRIFIIGVLILGLAGGVLVKFLL